MLKKIALPNFVGSSTYTVKPFVGTQGGSPIKIPQLPSLSPSPDRGSFSGINKRPVITNPPPGKSAIGNISGYISQRPPVVLGGANTPAPQNQLNYYSPNI